MNTSSETGGLIAGSRAIQSFRYPPMPVRRPLATGIPAGASPEAGAASPACSQQELAAARERGFQEGKAEAALFTAQAVEQERSALTVALTEFSRQQREFFRGVEAEAVRLALSIARKILHREAQMDPLLLAGVMRVALEQIHAGTRVRLRTSPAAAEAWTKFVATQLPGEHRVEVVPDAALENHRCLLEAELGTTEISLDAQLREVESGFFDLLRQQLPEQP